MSIVDILVIVVIAGACIIGARRIYAEATGKRSCCTGDMTCAQHAHGPKDRDRTHYPYSETFGVKGMSCAGCAKTVTAALETEGVLAEVALDDSQAKVFAKEPIEFEKLASAVHASGYRLVKSGK